MGKEKKEGQGGKKERVSSGRSSSCHLSNGSRQPYRSSSCQLEQQPSTGEAAVSKSSNRRRSSSLRQKQHPRLTQQLIAGSVAAGWRISSSSIATEAVAGSATAAAIRQKAKVAAVERARA
jgi:hypothetical protein